MATIRVNDAERKFLREQAARRGVSVSALLRFALARYVDGDDS
jgi:hypothetical protein